MLTDSDVKEQQGMDFITGENNMMDYKNLYFVQKRRFKVKMP